MSGFTDKLQQADQITVALNCGLCGQPAQPAHTCSKQYLRKARLVRVRSLADPSSTDPSDLFLVQVEQGGEEYTTTRVMIARDYSEI